MTLDWTQFTPWSAFAGGIILGAATAALLLFNDRIAGISGILGGLLRPVSGDIGWRLAFVAGVVAAPMAWGLVAPLPPIRIEAGTGVLVTAGLLVGVGTRFGAGCTSGHGICGLSRLSLRSLVATLAFMGTGFFTVLVTRHLIA